MVNSAKVSSLPGQRKRVLSVVSAIKCMEGFVRGVRYQVWLVWVMYDNCRYAGQVPSFAFFAQERRTCEIMILMIGRDFWTGITRMIAIFMMVRERRGLVTRRFFYFIFCFVFLKQNRF